MKTLTSRLRFFSSRVTFFRACAALAQARKNGPHYVLRQVESELQLKFKTHIPVRSHVAALYPLSNGGEGAVELNGFTRQECLSDANLNHVDLLEACRWNGRGCESFYSLNLQGGLEKADSKKVKFANVCFCAPPSVQFSEKEMKKYIDSCLLLLGYKVGSNLKSFLSSVRPFVIYVPGTNNNIALTKKINQLMYQEIEIEPEEILANLNAEQLFEQFILPRFMVSGKNSSEPSLRPPKEPLIFVSSGYTSSLVSLSLGKLVNQIEGNGYDPNMFLSQVYTFGVLEGGGKFSKVWSDAADWRKVIFEAVKSDTIRDFFVSEFPREPSFESLLLLQFEQYGRSRIRLSATDHEIGIIVSPLSHAIQMRNEGDVGHYVGQIKLLAQQDPDYYELLQKLISNQISLDDFLKSRKQLHPRHCFEVDVQKGIQLSDVVIPRERRDFVFDFLLNPFLPEWLGVALGVESKPLENLSAHYYYRARSPHSNLSNQILFSDRQRDVQIILYLTVKIDEMIKQGRISQRVLRGIKASAESILKAQHYMVSEGIFPKITFEKKNKTPCNDFSGGCTKPRYKGWVVKNGEYRGISQVVDPVKTLIEMSLHLEAFFTFILAQKHEQASVANLDLREQDVSYGLAVSLHELAVELYREHYECHDSESEVYKAEIFHDYNYLLDLSAQYSRAVAKENLNARVDNDSVCINKP